MRAIYAIVKYNLERKKADLSACAIALYDRYIVPPTKALDLLFGGFFGKNVHVVASKD